MSGPAGRWRVLVTLSGTVCLLIAVFAWTLLGEVLHVQALSGPAPRSVVVPAVLAVLGTPVVLGMLVRAAVSKSMSRRLTRLRQTLVACAAESILILLTLAGLLLA